MTMKKSKLSVHISFLSVCIFIVGAKLFKETYRDYLDSMNFNDATLHRLVSEANIAFVLNMRIFQEIDVKAGIPGSNVIPLEEAFAFGDKIIDITENNKDGDKCPFGFTNPDKKVTKVKKLSVVLDDEKKNRDGRCPWPFVVFHDPFTFIMDYQTWFLIALLSCWLHAKGWLIS
mmetsp:Transcript_32600/g.75016  ORF Transcript_32600/g.75016 Transcript_32600/m.75016 type:complete len:174 (+) Transcript_32600:1291-1812(+)